MRCRDVYGEPIWNYEMEKIFSKQSGLERYDEQVYEKYVYIIYDLNLHEVDII